MLAKRIIPCLDVKDGRVVKGVNFLNLVDAGDPVEIACQYSRQNADEIIFLDITASYEKRSTMVEVVSKTAEKVFIPLTVGGGIRSLKDIRDLLNVGCDKVSLNTMAVQNPHFIKSSSDRFGSQCIVVAIDAKRNNRRNCWQVYIHGGRTPTGIDVIQWAKKVVQLGAGEILLTSMDCDGTKKGYDINLTRLVAESVSVPVIASGGAGSLKHLYNAFTMGKADAVLAASIFHFGEYSISEAKKYLKSKKVPVRI